MVYGFIERRVRDAAWVIVRIAERRFSSVE